MSLQYTILGLLKHDPMTGYDLKKLFDKSIKNFWAASLSQIYRELAVLEGRGFVESDIKHQDDRPDKKIYSITETGSAAFKDWITNFPDKLSKETRDEFSLRVFFGSNIDNDDLIEHFRRFISEKRKNIEEIKSIEQISEKYASDMKLKCGEERYWKLILKRAKMNLETSITWAGECIEELSR